MAVVIFLGTTVIAFAKHGTGFFGFFLPHGTPIWLTADPASAPGERSVLVNIGQVMPPGVERFARLFDIVSNEMADRQQGRLRWKSYAAKGWQVNPHEVKE